MNRTTLLVLALALTPVLAASAARKRDPLRHYAAAARELHDELASWHITRRAPDDTISRRAWTNYLDACDSARMVFTAADIAAFAKWEVKLDDQLRTGDFAFAQKVRRTYRARFATCVAYATNFLETARFDFSDDGDWMFDRGKAVWPESVAAREALWRDRLRSDVLDEYLSCETGGVKAAAAKVAKRYVNELHAAQKYARTEVCEDFFGAIVSAFDAHSIYMNRTNYETFSSEMNLTFCGIGAEWEAREGSPKIKRIMPGGPLRRDGRVKAGDVILEIAPRGQKNSKFVPLADKNVNEISKLMKGEKGSPITLKVRHPKGDIACYTIIRDVIQLEESAASSSVITLDVDGRQRPFGLLRLPSFYQAMDASGRSCAEDVRNELLKLREAGVCGVLFDLRGNSGGSLEDAVKIIGCFVRTGPAVRMIGPTGDVTLPVPEGGAVCEVPVVVLTSHMSASAGELVPATLQDLGRAVIAGDRQTFGKGSAQSVHPISIKGMGAATITDSRFYRLSGESTQIDGVRPDLMLPSPEMGDEIDSERTSRYPLPGDRVARAEFESAWDLGRFVPELKARSERRLAANAKWTEYLDLVRRSFERAACKTVPLSKARRQAFNDAETQLMDELDALGERLGKPSPRGGDLVLDEAFNVLVDLVRLNGGRTLPAARLPVAPPPGVFEGLDDDE